MWLRALTSLLSIPPPYDAEAEWKDMTKRTVARFARGNIAIQRGRMLLPSDQAAEHECARKIALRWKDRLKRRTR